ncbi:MAG TPA: hypothetical protein VFY05_04260, partial [Candidatus Angelobacter sp.]|nr:hypothetical protein [Candidatus Angelobacter sp.]
MTEYRNPQDDPGSQRRLMLAFFLVFVLIAVMQFFLPKPQPQKTSEPKQKTAQQQQAQATPAAPATTATVAPAAHTKRRAATPATKAHTKQAGAETETVLENEAYKITFTNRGGLV